jgi:hypothetical protein
VRQLEAKKIGLVADMRSTLEFSKTTEKNHWRYYESSTAGFQKDGKD